MMIKLVLTFSLLALIQGCSTVTIQPKASQKLSSQPSYEESKSFYFWGIHGEHRIDAKQICGEQGILQMQSQQTFANGLLTGITLGIYSPHSVKIWCDS